MKSNVLRLVVVLLMAVASLGLKATNTLTVSPIAGDTGSEVEVTVTLDSSEELGALQVTIPLSEGCSVEIVESSATALGRAAGFSASAGVRDGRISAMLYSLTGRTIAAGSGAIMRFRVNIGNSPTVAVMKATVKATTPAGTETYCAGSDVELKCLCPVIELTATAVDFGRVALGSTARRSISFHNAGTSELVLTGIDMGREDFKVLTPLPIRVAAGSTGSAEIEFTPQERGRIVFPAQLLSNSVAAYNVTEISATPYAVNTITLGRVSGVSDSEVTVPVTVANMDGINGFSLEIKLPSSLEYVDGSFALNADRNSGHSCVASCSDGVLKLMAYSLTNDVFNGNGGEIASFRLNLKGKGTYTLSPSKAVLSAFYKGEITNVLSDSYNGSVTISYPSISVNSSLSLGRTAVPARATAQLRISNNGNSPLTISRLALDGENLSVAEELPLTIPAWNSAYVTVSCEGETTGEFKGVLSIYSNDPDKRLVTVNVSAVRYADNHLVFSSEETPVNASRAEITVGLENYSPLKGIQFDLHYPADCLIPLDEVTVTGRADGFQIMKRDIAEGTARYFVFSLTGKEIAPGAGSVLKLPFELNEGNTIGALTLTADNFSLGSGEMENMNSQLSSVSFNLVLVEKPLIKGDLDRNGRHSVADAIQAISIHIGKTPVGEKLPVIDMNDDSELTVSDILAIIAKIIKS